MAGNSDKKRIDNSVVQNLDLNKYLGTWYEIARYDHRFERDMDGVTANYSLMNNGMIKVINSGYKGGLDGKYKEAEGKARIPNPNEPSKLEVAFFLNFWGDYYVMELAEDYRFALIGSKTDKYLWILSRTPVLAESDHEFLIKRIRERGYDENKLIWVKHCPPFVQGLSTNCSN
jgi:apolipoprotein D and lipocalin family protein